ncbi:exopolysaccharide biosynthesis polyprenyl glycosylphosphotransferase [Promicromonospora soli]|uniref:Exopolysaccharide biosynthesis polyprenyl glycosylphosphotransferase n=1 Tax=Promicromonospora soli TaxID=2035533 RepID=A0A919FVJ2_9MICO|nr:exopolysaccharide biosynthesis polyprenyl glycosylphosphotransferase [Promicromonospora soli]
MASQTLGGEFGIHPMTGVRMKERPARGFHDIRAALGRPAWQARYQARLRFTDALVVVGAAVVAYVLDATPLFGAPSSPNALRSVIVPALVAAVWIGALAASNSYDLRVVGRDLTEYRRILSATWTSVSVLVLTAWLTSFAEARDVLPQTIAVPLGLAGLIASRYAWRQSVLRARREGSSCMTAVLVVGHREQAERVVRLINDAPERGLVAVGACIPSDGWADGMQAPDTSLPRDTLPGDEVAGVPILGDLSRVGEAAALVRASAVAVSASGRITTEVVRRLAWQLERAGVDLMLTAELSDLAVSRVTVSPASGISLLHVAAPRFEGHKFHVKQVMDWSLAALLTLLVSPVLVGVGLAVVLTSKGGLFYLSERVGRGGKIFRMVKFRTMHVGADREVLALATGNEAAGPLFKMRSDPRITRVGRVLRRYSLDELPQLFNVLSGQMSLVGPRPALPHEVAAYEERMQRRLLVKPGMTGMWQVSGRSDLPWDEAVRLDVYYAENWTPFMDLLILAQTARAVVTGRGAY